MLLYYHCLSSSAFCCLSFSASDSGKSSSYKEPVAKKKKLVEKLVDRVFRKTGRDKVLSADLYK